jgi:hypothetical protein
MFYIVLIDKDCIFDLKSNLIAMIKVSINFVYCGYRNYKGC